MIAHWYRKGDFDGDALWQTAKNMVGFVTCTTCICMEEFSPCTIYVGPTALVHCVDVVFTTHSFTM